MLIVDMRITHLRQADLNLLVVFAALAEERNVSRAAERLLLSQPAVSRALQRLRGTFHDDLLIRTGSGYEPTPKGERLLQELSTTLPRLDRFLSGGEFDPDAEETTFRVAVTDHASHVLGPVICRTVLPQVPKVSFDFIAFGDQTFDAIEKGRLDLLLNADDGYLPPHFERETIFEDGFACVAASGSNYSRKLTLKQYRGATHVGVGILGGIQTIPDKRLAAIGAKRRCAIWVPYFSAAIRCLPGTALLATVPARMARFEGGNPHLKVLRPPDVLGRFRYLMAWHPRMNTDASHLWLRKVIREAGTGLLAG
jgi:DNA-binding transcriptional LysR family regulator